MNDTFLDQPMKSVMKTYIAGEILQVQPPCATATQCCYHPLRNHRSKNIARVSEALTTVVRIRK